LREAVGDDPKGKRGWPLIMVAALVAELVQDMSRSAAAAMALRVQGLARSW
jgi:hypothetical protein